MSNNVMELNLNEMNMVNGGWDWHKCGVGAACGSIYGGVAGALAGAYVGGPVGALVGGAAGAAVGAAGLGTYCAIYAKD